MWLATMCCSWCLHVCMSNMAYRYWHGVCLREAADSVRCNNWIGAFDCVGVHVHFGAVFKWSQCSMLCCRAVGGVMRMVHGQVAWFMSEWPCKVCLGGWCHGLRQRQLCVGRSMHCLLLGMRKSRVSCACLQLGEDHSLSSFLRGEIQALVSCMFHSHRVAFTVKGGVTYTSS